MKERLILKAFRLGADLDKFEWESFMEDTVDLGAAGELGCADLGTRTLDVLLKILTERGDHSETE